MQVLMKTRRTGEWSIIAPCPHQASWGSGDAKVEGPCYSSIHPSLPCVFLCGVQTNPTWLVVCWRCKLRMAGAKDEMHVFHSVCRRDAVDDVGPIFDDWIKRLQPRLWPATTLSTPKLQ
jgi:hypothetical protein